MKPHITTLYLYEAFYSSNNLIERAGGNALSKLREYLSFSTKELALVSVFSSLWIVSQLYLAPIIHHTIQVHGVVQRVVGWFLMLILAELTGKFGRVTIMSVTSSIATRIIRMGSVYSLFVGAGYALGGFIFDLLFSILKRIGKLSSRYILFISLLSGAAALLPYLLFKLSVLGFYGFTLWIPYYIYVAAKGILLTVAGTTLGLSILPKIKNSLHKQVTEK